MNRIRLSPKFINRCVVGLALLAPIVYLFGSLFTGLIGAHGQEVFADEETIITIDPLAPIPSGLDIKFTFQDTPTNYPGENIYFSFYSANTEFRRMIVNTTNGLLVYQDPNGAQVNAWYQGDWNGEFKTIYFTSSAWNGLNDHARAVLASTGFLDVMTSESSISNSRYVFSQFFTKDNFVSHIGENALSDNPVGFTPFSDLFKYIDDNVLHLADGSTGVGVMAYGYMYWCAHVLLLDLIFYVSVFFIRLVKNVLDKLEGSTEL